jgi:uncharacterized protein (TIGR02300 family)
VAKAGLGTKRVCGHCAAKFYDLNKDPITCPKCGAVFQAAALGPRTHPQAVVAAAGAAPLAADIEVPEVSDAEFVSLEEADAEAEGAKGAGEMADTDEDIEVDGTLDDAAFIEEEEEDEDVTGIIGDVDNEEET